MEEFKLAHKLQIFPIPDLKWLCMNLCECLNKRKACKDHKTTIWWSYRPSCGACVQCQAVKMSKEQNSAVGFRVISRVPARSYSDLRSALYCKRSVKTPLEWCCKYLANTHAQLLIPAKPHPISDHSITWGRHCACVRGALSQNKIMFL